MADLEDKIQELLNRIVQKMDYIDLILQNPIDEKYDLLKEEVESIKQIGIDSSLKLFTSSVDKTIKVYNDIKKFLFENNLSLISKIEEKYDGDIDEDLIKVEILEKTFRPVSPSQYTILIKNGIKVIDNGLISDLYYMKISQNLDNTEVDILQDKDLKIDSVKHFNNNISNIYFTNNIDNLKDFIDENSFISMFIMINNKKYKIVKCGGTKKNNKKLLVFKVYPKIEDNITTSTQFSIYYDLFDDEIVELVLTDYDMNDIGPVYFNDVERNLKTGQMRIKDRNGTLDKYIFDYSIDVETNIETRTVNGG